MCRADETRRALAQLTPSIGGTHITGGVLTLGAGAAVGATFGEWPGAVRHAPEQI